LLSFFLQLEELLLIVLVRKICCSTFLRFCVPRKVFISSAFLKDGFYMYKFLVAIFSSSILNISSHSPLLVMSAEKSPSRLTEILLYVIS
jgi:hypothetical protein